MTTAGVLKVCAVDDCDRGATSRGWCDKHYQRWRKHGDPLKLVNIPGRKCDVDECSRPHSAHGYCRKHFDRLRRTGSVDLPKDDPSTISGVEAAGLVGVTYRKLDYWLTEYRPLGEGDPNPGSGHPRSIARTQLPVLHAFAELVGLGLKVSIVGAMTHQQRLRVLAVLKPVARGLEAAQ